MHLPTILSKFTYYHCNIHFCVYLLFTHPNGHNPHSILINKCSCNLLTGESEDRAKTRERFNEVFKKYTDLEKKKVKKKSRETQETIVVCVLSMHISTFNDGKYHLKFSNLFVCTNISGQLFDHFVLPFL